MKKQYFSTTNIKVYTTALATAFILTTGFTPAVASENSANTDKAKITFVGSEKNILTFNIDFKNEEELPFVLALTDEMGQVLYQKKFTGKTFNKNILLKSMDESSMVNFTIKTPNKTITQKFDIGTETKWIEEVVVTKL